MLDKREENLAKLSNHFGGAINKSLAGPSLKGDYKGAGFTISFWGAEDKYPVLEINYEKASALRLKIGKSSFLEWFKKMLGLSRVVKTGDQTFNQIYSVSSKDSEAAILYLNNAQIKDAIKSLFDKGFGSLQIDGKRITIVKMFCSLEDIEDQNRISEILNQLNTLTQGL